MADLSALAEAIRGVTAANSLHPFVIKADRLVRYGAIDQVLEELRVAHAQNVSLLSQGEDHP